MTENSHGKCSFKACHKKPPESFNLANVHCLVILYASNKYLNRFQLFLYPFLVFIFIDVILDFVYTE